MEGRNPNYQTQMGQNKFSDFQNTPQQNIFQNQSQSFHINQNNMNFFNNNMNQSGRGNPNFMNNPNMSQNLNQIQNQQNRSQLINQINMSKSSSNLGNKSVHTYNVNKKNVNSPFINSMDNNNMNNDINSMNNNMNNFNINNSNNMNINMNMNNNMGINDINNNMNINLDNNFNNQNNMNNMNNFNNDINNMNMNMNMNMGIGMSINNNNNNPNLNPNLNMNNNNEQNILNQICDTHVKHLSIGYDYAPSQATSHLNSLLKDMDSFGQIIKKKIENEQLTNPTKFISVDEAFNSGNEHLKCLAKLKVALNSEGCTCEIERNNLSEDEVKEIYTTIQFIVNGMYKFKKYIFRFDFGEEKNKVMLSDDIARNNFNADLTKKLCSVLTLNFKDIIINNPFKDSLIFVAIIKNSNFNEMDEIQLLSNLKNDDDFNTIINVEKTILLNGCKLSLQMLDQRGDRNVGWGINEIRGGKPYFPPIGWNGYGLNVLDRYDSGDNTWLDYQNLQGEWSVAYHGMGASLTGEKKMNSMSSHYNFNVSNEQTVIRQQFKNSDDKYHIGGKVGEGVYMTPNPIIMEQFSSVYQYGGEKYKIGIMCRVKPDSIRCPNHTEDYWIINGTDNEVRPYRILIKNQ